MHLPKKAMRFSLLLLICMGMAVPCRGQSPQEYLFSYAYSPGKTYGVNTLAQGTLTYSIEGRSAASKEKLKSTKFPVEVKVNQELQAETVTGEIDKEGYIPFTTRFMKHKRSATVNGGSAPSNGDRLFEGFTVTGSIDRETARPMISRVEGKDLDPQIETMVMQVVINMLSEVQFPTTAVKIGDTFLQAKVEPVSLPGAPTLEIPMVIKYKLKEVKANIAIFEIIAELGIKNTDTRMSFGGSGSGSLRYDLASHFPVDEVTSIDMEINLEAPEAVMRAKNKTRIQIDYFIK
jgi:hypothetical protein